MTSKVLIITGMHRSGTSLTAQYLNYCGLNIGNNLLTNNFINQGTTYGGHHEDREFLNFHQRILARKKIYGFPTEEFKLPVNIFDKRKALKLLTRRKDLNQWGWKDPRTTLFLDFWDEIIEKPKYLFLIRHPLSVVDSLIRRAKDPSILSQPIIGLKSWKLFNQRILSFFYRHPGNALLFNIDDLFDKHDVLVDKLNNQLGIKLKSSPLVSIISTTAFHKKQTELSCSVNRMKNKYQKEVNDCVFLYEKIKKEYYNQF